MKKASVLFLRRMAAKISLLTTVKFKEQALNPLKKINEYPLSWQMVKKAPQLLKSKRFLDPTVHLHG